MNTKATQNAGDTKGTHYFALVSMVSLAVIAFLAHQWWRNEEHAITRRLDGLAATLSAPASDADLARLTRVAQLRGYFAEDVRIRFGSQEVSSRDELIGFLGRWTPPPGGLTVKFVDVKVAMGDGETAQVYLTAKLSGRDAPTGEPTVDAREANVTMAKRGGEWVLTGVESTDTLQRP
jgi:hypothetical protein